MLCRGNLVRVIFRAAAACHRKVGIAICAVLDSVFECSMDSAKCAIVKAKLTQLKNTVAKYEENDKSKPDFDNLTDSAKKFIDAHNEVVKIADETSGYINSTERKLPALLKSLTQITKNIDELGKELSTVSDQISAIPIEEKSEELKPTEKDIFDTFVDEFKI